MIVIKPIQKIMLIKIILMAAILSIAGCGFSPVYGTHNINAHESNANASLKQIRIAPLPDRSGQYLRNALIDRFYTDGYPINPIYLLKIEALKEYKTAFDITVESEATRYQLKISTALSLLDTRTEQNLLQRNLYATSSYNVLESEFSTRVSEQNAREAILNDLARQIEQQITLYLNR